jgi:diaminohydroxyphosphoribosylaminopyrimidine deaminase/5-amino-6-(5-phosphoribosylamino)uracil reductase
MREALDLAGEAIGLSDPNPRVGCVLLGPDGKFVGRGHTQAAGQAHAEIMALRDAAARGLSTLGATAIVTLEPCSHHGRTGPCCDALVAAGVARVVVALEDPNPLVAGAGIQRLRAAGVRVEVGIEAEAARELNIGFFSRMQRGRPFVRMKAAASLDGRLALNNGVSQWITGEAARLDGHVWRRRAGAILTGVGTVLADDPRLDVRLVPTQRQPLRIVVDSQLRTPPKARILQPPGASLLVHARPATAVPKDVETLAMPGPTGQVDLTALLAELGRKGVNELHVEAGPALNGAMLALGLVDELLLYQAPVLLGEGLPIAHLGPWEQMSDVLRWRLVEALPLGPDLRLRLRPA